METIVDFTAKVYKIAAILAMLAAIVIGIIHLTLLIPHK